MPEGSELAVVAWLRAAQGVDLGLRASGVDVTCEIPDAVEDERRVAKVASWW